MRVCTSSLRVIRVLVARSGLVHHSSVVPQRLSYPEDPRPVHQTAVRRYLHRTVTLTQHPIRRPDFRQEEVSVYEVKSFDLALRRFIDAACLTFANLVFSSKWRFDTAMVYLCATMWHETYDEMLNIIISIFRSVQGLVGKLLPLHVSVSAGS